jgi:hypothetical protein
MSDLFRLSQAMAKGRTLPTHKTREEILVALLRQRAEAYRHGLAEQESMLRNQITWSLPVQSPDDEKA